MSRTISIAGDVEKMLERCRLEVIKSTGNVKPSYSDILRFILREKMFQNNQI